MSLDIRDARRFRAMTAGFAARGRGLPLEAMPPGTSKADRDWWEAGWCWRDDQLGLAARDREIAALRREIDELRGVDRP